MALLRLQSLCVRHPYAVSGIPYATMALAYLMLRVATVASHMPIVVFLIGVIAVLIMGCIAGSVVYRRARPIVSRAVALIGAVVCGLYAVAYFFVGTVGTR